MPPNTHKLTQIYIHERQHKKPGRGVDKFVRVGELLLSADILPQNTMYNNIRYNEPQKLGGGFSPLAPPLSTPLPGGTVILVIP